MWVLAVVPGWQGRLLLALRGRRLVALLQAAEELAEAGGAEGALRGGSTARGNRDRGRAARRRLYGSGERYVE